MLTIGIDLGGRTSDVCILGGDRKVVNRFKMATTSSAIQKRLSHFPRPRVIIEVGSHSPWVSRLLSSMGCEVVVANPNKVRLIGHSVKKTDAHDAEVLARLGQMGPELLSPIQHRSEAGQRDLMTIRARDGIVAART